MMGSKGNMRQAIFLKIYVCRQIISEPFSAVTPQLLPQLCTLQVAPDNHTLWEARCVPGPSSRMRTQKSTPMLSAGTLSLSEKVEKQKISKNHSESIFRGPYFLPRVSMCLLQSSSNAPLTAGNMGGTWREISAAEVGTLLEFSNCLWLQNCSPEAA